MSDTSKIYYTITDEAPALATYSFLPIVKAFTKKANIEVEVKDISLAARILCQFPDCLTKEQQKADTLSELGELTQNPKANIIKLPNISASIPQLMDAIEELQKQGYKVPDFPESPSTETEQTIRKKYAKVLGSAVNPVLREGNSDRRVAKAVKAYAQKNPHRLGEWSKDSKTNVFSMSEKDFYSTEKSVCIPKAQNLKIALKTDSGLETLKECVAILNNEVVDCAALSAKSLTEYFEQACKKAQNEDVLLSLHLKATMMKVSDPILFGHGLKVYFKDVFSKHQETFDKLGVNPNFGLEDLNNKLDSLQDENLKNDIKSDIKNTYNSQPDLAMVNSDKGITNLHMPNDVIIDASMPAALKSSGKMWGPDGQLKDTLACIPDRSYAGVYQTTIDFCKTHGAFDVTTMGNVSNVGLMAKKAEEYGSHDKTFEIKTSGTVQVLDESNNVLMEQAVEPGDIFRMCQTKDISVKDWVKLAVTRSKLTGNPAVFWLDANRAHDAQLIQKVESYLAEHDTSGLEIKILAPNEATAYTLNRIKEGLDTISVTGNVLRDYLTDLFPILELGTSAKMLSIVPLLAGGGLYETGAGGSAPKHVDQFVQENHLRWDSLGEFLALGVSLEDISLKFNNNKAMVLAEALEVANNLYLSEDKSPSRKVKELDNRGSHFYIAKYWAQALAEQNKDEELKAIFSDVTTQINNNTDEILNDLINNQGSSVNMEGYYNPNTTIVAKAMRPSSIFNNIIDSL